MQTVASRDGTRIAFGQSGGGPPLLLVHGATADHTTTWRFVLPEPGVIDRLEAMLGGGDLEGMLVVMFRELVEMPAEELELLRSQREAWAARLGNAPTLPRELRVEENYIFSPERFTGMLTPTLLLVGGDSPLREQSNAKGVAEALPDARVVALPGQQHAAMYSAPELFVREVVRFFES